MKKLPIWLVGMLLLLGLVTTHQAVIAAADARGVAILLRVCGTMLLEES